MNVSLPCRRTTLFFSAPRQLTHELTRMHSQLQKFSVALEQMSEDNRVDHPHRHSALSETKKHVKLVSIWWGAPPVCSFTVVATNQAAADKLN